MRKGVVSKLIFGAPPFRCVIIDKMHGTENEADKCLLIVNGCGQISKVMKHFAIMTHLLLFIFNQTFFRTIRYIKIKGKKSVAKPTEML